ncbi:MAG: hypothetical protein WKF86_09995, partial [Acidimicrobiales bacterium]
MSGDQHTDKDATAPMTNTHDRLTAIVTADLDLVAGLASDPNEHKALWAAIHRPVVADALEGNLQVAFEAYFVDGLPVDIVSVVNDWSEEDGQALLDTSVAEAARLIDFPDAVEESQKPGYLRERLEALRSYQTRRQEAEPGALVDWTGPRAAGVQRIEVGSGAWATVDVATLEVVAAEGLLEDVDVAGIPGTCDASPAAAAVGRLAAARLASDSAGAGFAGGLLALQAAAALADRALDGVVDEAERHRAWRLATDGLDRALGDEGALRGLGAWLEVFRERAEPIGVIPAAAARRLTADITEATVTAGSTILVRAEAAVRAAEDALAEALASLAEAVRGARVVGVRHESRTSDVTVQAQARAAV